MKKLFAIVMAMLLIMTMAFSCTAEEFKGQIKIGALCGLTATQAVNGDMMVKSFNLKIDEVNAAGGIGGYELVLEEVDSADDVDSAINAVNLLLPQEDIIAIIGPQLSGQVYAIDELVKSSNIPFLIGGTNPGIPALKNPNLYGIRTNDAICAKAAIKFLVEAEFEAPVTKVAIMCATDDFGAGGQAQAIAYLDEIGMPYEVEPHNVDDTDMSSSIMKMQNKGCDAIFMWTQGNCQALLARQLYELEYNVPRISNLLDQATVVNLCEPEWLENWYCTSDFFEDSEDTVVVEFKQKFTEKYGVAPSSIGACYYSGITVLVDALERCEDPTSREQLAVALMETKDVAGPTGTFTARPEENQQLIWGVNILKRTLEKYEFEGFISG